MTEQTGSGILIFKIDVRVKTVDILEYSLK